jgi:Predicted RNA-binding protein containing a PIN domain
MKAYGKPPKRVLIVDGYNIINAGHEYSGATLADARDKLVSALIDYAGYSGQQVIVVFDAWMSDRQTRTEEKHGAVTVVFTQKGEIADRYIERLCDDFAQDIEYRRVEVRVASSDALEQTIVLGRGATRTVRPGADVRDARHARRRHPPRRAGEARQPPLAHRRKAAGGCAPEAG